MAKLTDNHKLLLAVGLSRGEQLSDTLFKDTLLMAEDAYALYSDKSTGHDALCSMVMMGFIEITDVPGRFRVTAAPGDVQERAKTLRSKRKEKELIADESAE